MRAMWIIMAAISFLIVVPISISYYNDYTVFKKGHLVEVIITGVPDNTLNFKSGFIKFECNGRAYDIKVYAHGNYHVGDTLTLKYLEGYENNFLLANENPSYTSIFLILLLMALGIYSVHYAIIKKPLGS
jgi:hypothetical protein